MNTVKKNEKTYIIRECKNHWNVSADSGRLAVSYRVFKDVCPTFEDLKAYIENENIF